jgi:hypothetical protein
MNGISMRTSTGTGGVHIRWSVLAGLAVAIIGLGGCRQSTAPGTAAEDLALTAGSLTGEIIQFMEAAIQDEYHAEMVYRRVIADFGEVRPFTNIVNAEVRHASALAVLFTRYGLEVPESTWHLENVPNFESVRDACQAAAEAEVANVALYDEFLQKALPEDVRIVFENNRRASLEKHLPAFRRCG